MCIRDRVSSQLEAVYRGLGDMQNIASGVGDLKRVLSNVKTRGILGEVQLGAILRDILTADQYAENVATKPGSTERVEFAVKLPVEGGDPIWLPIDSKFPGDTYEHCLLYTSHGDAAHRCPRGAGERGSVACEPGWTDLQGSYK